MFWVVVWRLPGMMFCGLTRAGGSMRPDQRKRNLARQTSYAAAGEHSRLFQLTINLYTFCCRMYHLVTTHNSHNTQRHTQTDRWQYDANSQSQCVWSSTMFINQPYLTCLDLYTEITGVNCWLTGTELLYDVALVDGDVENVIENSNTPDTFTSTDFMS